MESKRPLLANDYLSRLMKEADIPGMSIAGISQGQRSWENALGVVDAESGHPVTKDTVFAAASLSKPVFAYLVWKLIEKGRLDQHFLEQPLYEILPEYKPFFVDASGKSIRFDHNKAGEALNAGLVLSHRTGLPNWIHPGEEFKFEEAWQPGEKYRYSGEGFHYLQKAIEAKTKQSLQALAKEYVFDPLLMEHSSFSMPDERTMLAIGHNELGEPQPPTGRPEENAGGSLHTTASDYARFLVACLDERNKHFRTFLEAIISMTEDTEIVGKDIAKNTLQSVAWTLGWGLQKTHQEPIAFHWGDKPNFKAFTAINLTDRSAVVYFTNSENGLSIAHEIINPVVGDLSEGLEFLFHKYDYERYNKPGLKDRHAAQKEAEAAEKRGDYPLAIECFEKALKLAPPEKKKTEIERRIEWLTNLMQIQITPPAEERLKTYEGQYGPLLVTNKDNQLQLEIAGQKINLMPISDNTFLDINGKVKLTFSKDNESLTLNCHFVLDGNKRDYSRVPVAELAQTSKQTIPSANSQLLFAKPKSTDENSIPESKKTDEFKPF
jgi:CubicO group peptidase (beta-lactamase class C family)